MRQLSDTIRKLLPEIIDEINNVRIPALEEAWGRSFKDELENEGQVTVEIAKNYARPVNNTFYRHINAVLPEFTEKTIDGSDYMLGDIAIEDKNSFSSGNGWVGNGFNKTPIHLLKKFEVDENGRICKAFIALVDLSKTRSGWSDKTINTNRSVIQFTNEDINNIDVIVGSVRPKKKYIQPIMENIGSNEFFL